MGRHGGLLAGWLAGCLTHCIARAPPPHANASPPAARPQLHKINPKKSQPKNRRRCFYSLEAPPARVCGYDTPFPLVYEPLYLPTARRLADAIRRTLRQ